MQYSTTSGAAVGTTRPDNSRDLLKQLKIIERALTVRRKGGLAPRSARSTVAAVITFVAICGTAYRIRNLIGDAPTAVIGIAFCCAILIGCLVYRYSTAARSHSEYLDRLLAAYTPVSASAYSELQEKTKAAGSLTNQLVHEWLGREHRAISRSNDAEMLDQYRFLSKRQERTSNPQWQEHAYPLQQVTVQLQGTRHSDLSTVIAQLETVSARLRAGDVHGEDHDDDFGYRFEVNPASAGPSFFDRPCAHE